GWPARQLPALDQARQFAQKAESMPRDIRQQVFLEAAFAGVALVAEPDGQSPRDQVLGPARLVAGDDPEVAVGPRNVGGLPQQPKGQDGAQGIGLEKGRFNPRPDVVEEQDAGRRILESGTQLLVQLFVPDQGQPSRLTAVEDAAEGLAEECLAQPPLIPVN